MSADSISSSVGAVSILLIDSNHKDRLFYTSHLQASSPHYQIFEAATGKDGLRVCNSCVIDCVVLEIELPDMSGFEVLRKLVSNARQPEVAVVVLTRLNSQPLIDAAMSNGAQAAFHKLQTTGNLLDKTILSAISTLQRDRKRAMSATFLNPVQDLHRTA